MKSDNQAQQTLRCNTSQFTVDFHFIYKYHSGNFNIKKTILERIPVMVALVQDDPSAEAKSPNTFPVQFSNDQCASSVNAMDSCHYTPITDTEYSLQ